MAMKKMLKQLKKSLKEDGVKKDAREEILVTVAGVLAVLKAAAKELYVYEDLAAYVDDLIEETLEEGWEEVVEDDEDFDDEDEDEESEEDEEDEEETDLRQKVKEARQARKSKALIEA